MWTLQGLWAFLTTFPVLLTLSWSGGNAGNGVQKFPAALDFIGLTFWTCGIIFEVIADYQKQLFKKCTQNKGKFIKSGLWAISRHPNYFGEITLWIGVFLVACNEFTTMYHYISILSPIFVAFLLTKVSGIPLLESAADKKWGDDPEYNEYKRRTSILIPWVY